jgi:hypothetical protein
MGKSNNSNDSVEERLSVPEDSKNLSSLINMILRSVSGDNGISIIVYGETDCTYNYDGSIVCNAVTGRASWYTLFEIETPAPEH